MSFKLPIACRDENVLLDFLKLLCEQLLLTIFGL